MDGALETRPADCPIPLTALQLQMWSDIVRSPSPPSTRLVVTCVRMLGPLEISLLREAIDTLVQRHEPLRTRIVTVGGSSPIQQVDAARAGTFELVDLTKISPTDREAEARRLVQELIDARADYSLGPLFEARLLALSNNEHVLAIAIDHLVADAASCRVLSRELWTIYSQALQGRPFSLPRLCVQFADYAVWQHRTLEDWRRKHEPYWRERLTGAHRVQLPSDGEQDIAPHSTAVAHYPLGKELTTTLRELALRQETRLSTVVLAIYVCVLARWLSQRTLMLAFISHGRHLRPELKDMVGLLANQLILRIDVDQSESLEFLLNQVSAELRNAYEHYDFGRTLHLFPEHRPELFFNWSSIDSTESSIQESEARKLPISLRPFPTRTTWPVIFYPFFAETPSGVNITVIYRTDLFTKATIERFGRDFRGLARALARSPNSALASVASTV